MKYKNCLDKYILPQWKKLYVREIQQGTYDRLMEVLLQQLSGSSIQTINTIISGILKYTLNCLPVKCTGKVSEHAKRPLDILSDNESCKLLTYLDHRNDLISIGIRLTLFSGIRLGELCALTWADVDLEEQVIHIRHTLQRIQNRNRLPEDPKTVLYIGSPKNKRERSIPLHPQMIPILTKYKSRYPASYYLLSGTLSPVEPRKMTRHFKKIIKSCDIRDLHFHTLRHTFATRCVESGMQIKALSEMLGHSTVKITMDRYVHLSMSFKQSQITILQFPDLKEKNRQNLSQTDQEVRENGEDTEDLS